MLNNKWLTAEVDWETDGVAPENTIRWAQQEPHSAGAARGGHALDPAHEPGVGSLARGGEHFPGLHPGPRLISSGNADEQVDALQK